MTKAELDEITPHELARAWGHLQFIRQDEFKRSLAAGMGGLPR